MTEQDAEQFLDTTVGPGQYQFYGYKSYQVNGVDVVKIDYSWNSGLIQQSYVRVYFKGADDVIMFGALASIPEGFEEFNDTIETLTIK